MQHDAQHVNLCRLIPSALCIMFFHFIMSFLEHNYNGSCWGLHLFNFGSDHMTFNHVIDCAAGWWTFSAYCGRHDSFGSSYTICFIVCLSEG